MRHRRRSRVLGRSPSHRKALFKNLASALFLTERDKDEYLDEKMAPKVKGRIVTTLPKAKEVRATVERCITIARDALPALEAANKLGPNAERNTDAWRTGAKAKNGKIGQPPCLRLLMPDVASYDSWRQRSHQVVFFGRRSPLCRSTRRIHPRRAIGDSSLGRCRHSSCAGIRRRPRPYGQARPRSKVRGRTRRQVILIGVKAQLSVG